MKTEDEKLSDALAIAMQEINEAKDEKRADQAQDDEGMAEDTPMDAATAKEKKKKDKEKKKQEIKKLTQYLGTSKVIKLPYIIGSDEYRKHDYAGVIYMGDAENEQEELYAEE